MEHGVKAMQQEITGELSVKLANGQTLDDFCAEHVADYNRDRFEALAIRVFVGDETIITVFAIDKNRQEGDNFSEGKIPVKKFKLETMDLSSVLSYCGSFNFTLSTGNYQIADMEVINK